jgi:hypothetical protein
VEPSAQPPEEVEMRSIPDRRSDGMQSQRQAESEHRGHAPDRVQVNMWRKPTFDSEHLGVRDPDHRADSPAAESSGHSSDAEFLADPMQEVAGTPSAPLNDRLVGGHRATVPAAS